MSIDNQNTSYSSEGAIIDPKLIEQIKPWDKFISPAYQPAFRRVELTEIRAPFWGIANHAMHEYHDERR